MNSNNAGRIFFGCTHSHLNQKTLRTWSYAIIIQHVPDLWLNKPNRDPRVLTLENGVKILKKKVQTAAQGLTLLQSALKI